MGLSFRQQITRNLINLPGIRTKRNLVVIESDDWGSVRIPSKPVQKKMLSSKLINGNDSYANFDCLEDNDDMQQLFETLFSVKDTTGYLPVFTANTIVANPDFNKIREIGCLAYYYEPIISTYEKYPNHHKVFDLFKFGIEQQIFIPQFHGREHLNVAKWIKLLQQKDERFIEALGYGAFAIDTNSNITKRNNLMAAFDFYSITEKEDLMKIIIDGYQLFTKLFGYQSKSFIAPCYIWDDEMEALFGKLGVTNIQSTAIQAIPQQVSKEYKKRVHYSGQKNQYGQYYFIRNCFFEPSLHNETDPIGNTMRSIKIAFTWGKPAVISSHRVNYMGGLDENNRIENLKLLKNLLINITKEWPDVEFISSGNLYDVMLHKM